jgi:glycine reductase
MAKLKVVHYINQFFANIGGEEMAHVPAEKRAGHVGPGMGLAKEFKDEAEIVATIICGDSYFNENVDEALENILAMVREEDADLFIAGPAFNAGRYGAACGTVCNAVQEELGIPVVTAMYEENPGVDMFRKNVYMLETTNSAAGMRKALPKLGKFSLKLARNEVIGSPETEGYHARGVRRNLFAEENGATRAVDMLVAKLNGRDFVTEYPMPVFDNVAPGKAIADLSKARIALVTSGGIVPSENPDRIESSSASKYGQYEIENTGETAHGGYDPIYANEDPNRVLPVDVIKDLEAEGRIGSIHPYYYTTTGNGTSVANAKAFATEFAQKLVNDGVDAVILTST